MRSARVLALLLASSFLVGAVSAAPIRGRRPAKPARPDVVDNTQVIDINNISMFVTNTGSFAYDKSTGNSGLEFPKGTGKTAVFAAGLWLGARVGSSLRLAVSEYSDEFGPGMIIAGAPDDPERPEYRTYKISRVYDDTAVRDAAVTEWNTYAAAQGAQRVTVLGDGSLDITGDQMLFAVYNDLATINHSNRAGSTQPMGVEVRQTTFAFNRQGALGNTVFIRYKIFNKGANTLDSMFVSQWSDPDLGGASDDLVGTDTTLGLGFVYNATNNDEQYTTQPPAVGYDFLLAVTPDGDSLGLASFNKYINGTDPNSAVKSYNYMKGLDADGNVVINPVSGQPTRFQVSGDPVTGAGWLDTSPADRRLMLSTGPFTMDPGDSAEVVVAIVVSQSTNRLASISLMKFQDSFAQAAFDANFDLPNPPNSPNVTVAQRTGCIFLSWDHLAEDYNEAPYAFEGYNVYQGASVAGPFRRIATFDRVNGITTVLDPDFNEEQGLILPTGKAFGQDVGTRYSIEICDDVWRGGPLFDAQNYYYAVTSYAVGLGQFPQVLESAFDVISVTPQTPPAGVDLGSSSVSDVAQSQRAAGPPPTTDVVTATVVDPNATIDASWEFGFKPACDTCSARVWYLVRTTTTATDTVVNNGTNFSGDESFPVIDGVRVGILSYGPGELARVSYVDTAGGNPAALEGAHVDLRFFDGGADYAALLFGSSVPAFSVGPDVEIRFGPTSKAYRYLRSCSATPRTYLIQDFVDVPFQVWDIDANVQINAGWLENCPGDADDGIWNPIDDGLGGRELIWPMTTTYTGVVDSMYFGVPDALYGPGSGDNDLTDALGGHVDFRYVVWPNRPTAGTIIDPGDKIVFTTSIPSTSNDVFTFTTTRATQFDAGLARAELARVKAVPNPYFNHSTYELDQFNRVLKFTHLPARCTIRIFNLAGDLVRTIEKNDNTSQVEWDLETRNGLPVGSGIYVFHVDAPGVGTHVGKVAVFMEKERLSNF